MALLKNLSTLLDDPRRRNMILLTLLLFLTMVFVGGVRLLHQIRGKGLPSGVTLESTPLVRSVPGGLKENPSHAYAQLQVEYNKKKAEAAKKAGRSAIATMVDSFHLDSESATLESKKQGLSTLPKFMTEAESIAAEHEAFMSRQQTELTKQQIQSAIHQQMNQLFSAWSHAPTQSYEVSSIVTIPEKDVNISTQGPALVKAGAILHATLLTEVNSDEPSPVLAQITTGELKGGRLIGSLSRTGERLLIQFHTLNLPKEDSRALPVQALAIDEATARSSLASHVDRHLLLRYGSFFAALFVQYYGMHLQDKIVNSEQPKNPNMLNPQMPLLYAAGNVGNQVGTELAQQLHKAPTVCVNAGAAIGILFTADLFSVSSKKG